MAPIQQTDAELDAAIAAAALGADGDAPLVRAIRLIAASLASLQAGGFNRRAVVVLLVDQTKLSKKTVEAVLDALIGLNEKFLRPAQRKGASR